MFQGEGPYAGLISYYGGLYPLGLGLASEFSGPQLRLDPERRLVVRHAPLPAALLLLGRRRLARRSVRDRILRRPGHPRRPVHHELGGALGREHPAVGLVVLARLSAGHRAGPRVRGALGGDVRAGQDQDDRPGARSSALRCSSTPRWASFWPGSSSCWLPGGHRSKTREPLVEVVMAGRDRARGHGLVVDPSADRPSESGTLLIADHASRLPFNPGPLELLDRLWLCRRPGVGRQRLPRDQATERHPGLDLPGLVCGVPPARGAQPAVPALDLFTERRLWLVISLAAIGLATCGILLATRRTPALVLAVIVIATVVLPSIPANQASVRRVRNAVSVAWRPGNAGMARELDVESGISRCASSTASSASRVGRPSSRTTPSERGPSRSAARRSLACGRLGRSSSVSTRKP